MLTPTSNNINLTPLLDVPPLLSGGGNGARSKQSMQ